MHMYTYLFLNRPAMPPLVKTLQDARAWPRDLTLALSASLGFDAAHLLIDKLSRGNVTCSTSFSGIGLRSKRWLTAFVIFKTYWSLLALSGKTCMSGTLPPLSGTPTLRKSSWHTRTRRSTFTATKSNLSIQTSGER